MPLEREAETQAWALSIFALTGKYPQITRHDDQNLVMMDEDQLSNMKNRFRKMLDSKPSGVKVNLNEVITPVLLEKYMPLIILTPLALLIGGGLIGRALTK